MSTSASLWELDELQDRVVGGIRLVASIRMPGVSDVGWSIFPQVLGRIRSLVGGDHIEFRVLVQVVFGQRMDVQFGVGWFVRENPKALRQFFLKLISQVGLRAEEHHAATRDCCPLAIFDVGAPMADLDPYL